MQNEKEKSFYLKILDDFIHSSATPEESDIDWAQLIEIARRHRTDAIVHFQCRDFLPKDYSLSQQFLLTIYDSQNKLYWKEKITAEFGVIGIKSFVVKGSTISCFYSHPELRTSGDIDFIVSDFEKAHQVLVKFGFNDLPGDHLHEWTHSKNGCQIELHDRLVYDDSTVSPALISFFNNYEPYLLDGQLDGSFHFLFLLFHLQKHIMAKGVGFRQFVDIAVMILNCKALDWDWISKRLEELDMKGFALIVFALISRWFRVEAPIARNGEVSDDTLNKLTEQIFSNGVFGDKLEEDGNYQNANAIIKSAHPRLSSLKEIAKLLFPSYSTMRRMKNFSFVDGKPFLMPAAWIYRLVRVVFNHKAEEVNERITKKFVSSDYLSKRKEMYSLWNITLR